MYTLLNYDIYCNNNNIEFNSRLKPDKAAIALETSIKTAIKQLKDNVHIITDIGDFRPIESKFQTSNKSHSSEVILSIEPYPVRAVRRQPGRSYYNSMRNLTLSVQSPNGTNSMILISHDRDTIIEFLRDRKLAKTIEGHIKTLTDNLCKKSHCD